MDWYKIAFPEDLLSPFSEPSVLEKEVQEIYEKNGFPKGFTVYMEINQSHSRVYYFTPAACRYCAELFNSYRGGSCDEPVSLGKPIVPVAGE
ncbi:MAG: hypothetical protein ACR2LC_03465 [Pyrinomonadaceae bacterium]